MAISVQLIGRWQMDTGENSDCMLYLLRTHTGYRNLALCTYTITYLLIQTGCLLILNAYAGNVVFCVYSIASLITKVYLLILSDWFYLHAYLTCTCCLYVPGYQDCYTFGIAL